MGSPTGDYRLAWQPGVLWIERLPPDSGVPDGAFAAVRTAQAYTVVVSEPSSDPVPRSGPWRAFRVEGILEHDLTGILAGLTAPLAAASIPIFAVSEFDTDYVLVPESRCADAEQALSSAGWTWTSP